MKGLYLGRKYYREMFAYLLAAIVFNVSLWVVPEQVARTMLVGLGCVIAGFLIYLFWRGFIETPPEGPDGS